MISDRNLDIHPPVKQPVAILLRHSQPCFDIAHVNLKRLALEIPLTSCLKSNQCCCEEPEEQELRTPPVDSSNFTQSLLHLKYTQNDRKLWTERKWTKQKMAGSRKSSYLRDQGF